MRGERHEDHSSIQDEAGFQVFFTNYFSRAVGYCRYQFDLDTEEAKEVVQQSFLRLWEARHSLLSGVSPSAYLFTIIGNICKDRLRHLKVLRSHHRILLDESEEMAGELFADISVKELSQAIHRAIEGMPERMRRIFEMSRYEGLKYSAIAAELNLSVKTVETQMSRALERLRQQLSGFMRIEIIVVAAGLAEVWGKP